MRNLSIMLSPLSLEDQRLEWRKAQNEATIRSLASEYLRGIIDDCTTDAYLEYEQRFGPHTKGNKTTIKRPRKSKRK